MVELKTTRILLLGKTGAGKSSLANTIFKGELFNVCSGFESGTIVCEAKTKSVNGRKLTVIDTPGFFDTNRSEDELKPEIVRCITECSPGPHAFLIVLKVGRFTVQEEEVIHKITQRFSEEVYKFATVVFTHGHELPKRKTIKYFVKQNKFVSDFMAKCGGRCHVIDNKHWNNRLKCKYRSNKYQVHEILKSIDKTVEKNNGNCYTNEMLQEVEKLIQEEEKRIAESSENMSEEEIRTEAKNRVNKSYMQTAGIEIGALFGALFGAIVPVIHFATGITGVVKSAIEAAGGAVVRAAGGAIETGFTVGASVAARIGAAVGPGFGGYEGHQAAKAAETAWEAGETI